MNKLRIFWIITSIILGLSYYFFINVQINIINNQKIIIKSKIDQETKLYIRTAFGKSEFICNNQPVIFNNHKPHDSFYNGEEEISIILHKGKNVCLLNNISSNIKQKITFLNLFILLTLLGIPIFSIIFNFFIWFINQIKKLNIWNNKILYFIWLILGLGTIIRVIIFYKFGTEWFQHDIAVHIEYIKYIAEFGQIPAIPMKGIEFPQQPLYYVIVGVLYKILTLFDMNDKEIIYNIGYISLIASIVFLYYAYKLLKLLTDNQWIQFVAIVFISLTPSIVYISIRINNDSLVILVATMAIYFSVKSYQEEFIFIKTFLLALFFVNISFLTKISTLGIEILLFMLLILTYYRSEKNIKKILEQRLYIYGIVGLFVLSMTLLRLYIPIDSSFYMVNSGTFSNQTIQTLNIDYFFSLHLYDLIHAGTSYVFGKDSIRYSFLTYQYGTMIFGEFNYIYIMNQNAHIHFIMQLTLLFGIIYIIGFISYLIHLHNESILHKILFFILTINFILILKFTFTYPSICNTDFRYFVSSFVLFSYIFARGLSYLLAYNKLQSIINIILILLVSSELLFFYILVSVNK